MKMPHLDGESSSHENQPLGGLSECFTMRKVQTEWQPFASEEPEKWITRAIRGLSAFRKRRRRRSRFRLCDVITFFLSPFFPPAPDQFPPTHSETYSCRVREGFFLKMKEEAPEREKRGNRNTSGENERRGMGENI